jgi:F-type H+-transporting ATPase subunit b
VQLAYVLAQEAGGGESNPILPATNELIWGAIAFFILLFLMYRTVWPQVNKLYQERRAGIEGRLQQAEKEREEAEQLLQQYRERLAAAEDETQRILEEARANAERVRKDLLAKAENDAERQLDRDRQLRLVDRYIDRLGDQTQAGAMTSRREGSGGLTASPQVDRDGSGGAG